MIPAAARRRPRATGIAAGAGVPEQAGDPDAADAVLIASDEDPTARWFAERAAGAGRPLARFPLERVQSGRALEWLAVRVAAGTPDAPGIYLRPTSFATAPASAAFRLLADLVDLYPGVVVGTYRASTNASKPLHYRRLATIRPATVELVPTRVTTGLAGVPREHVVKAMGTLGSYAVTAAEAGAGRRGRWPTMSQPRVGGQRVRAHVCGGAVVACAIVSDRLDYRDAGFAVRPVELPARIAAWCRAAAALEGLELAGVDLVLDGSRTYCLEVNPNPGYSEFESRMDDRRVSEWLLARLAGGRGQTDRSPRAGNQSSP